MKPPVLFVFMLSASTAIAQQPEYAIREETPCCGYAIRQNLIGPTDIPVNLPYEQLSAADRRKFNENYESIAEGDEPPFPKAGLQAILTPIAKAEQRLFSTGKLFLVATVSPTGEVQEVSAYSSPSPELTKVAAQVLLLTPFKPAICGGKPCSMQFPLRINFGGR